MIRENYTRARSNRYHDLLRAYLDDWTIEEDKFGCYIVASRNNKRIRFSIGYSLDYKCFYVLAYGDDGIEVTFQLTKEIETLPIKIF